MRSGPRLGALLLLLLAVVSVLIAAVLASVVQMLLPSAWSPEVRLLLPTLVLSVALFAGQVWLFRELRRPPT